MVGFGVYLKVQPITFLNRLAEGHVREIEVSMVALCSDLGKVERQAALSSKVKLERTIVEMVLGEDQLGFGDVKLEMPLGHPSADLSRQLTTQGRGLGWQR